MPFLDSARNDLGQTLFLLVFISFLDSARTDSSADRTDTQYGQFERSREPMQNIIIFEGLLLKFYRS